MTTIAVEPVVSARVESTNAASTQQTRINFLRQAVTPTPLPRDNAKFPEYSLVFADKVDNAIAYGIDDALFQFSRLPKSDREANPLARSLQLELYPASTEHRRLSNLDDGDNTAGTALLTHEILKHVAWREGAGKKEYNGLQQWAAEIVSDPTNLTHQILFGDCSKADYFEGLAVKLGSTMATLAKKGTPQPAAMVETLRTVRELLNIRKVLGVVMRNKAYPRFESTEMQSIWTSFGVVDFPNLLRKAIDADTNHPLRFMIQTSEIGKLGDNDGEAINSIMVTDKFPEQPAPYGLGSQLESAEIAVCSKMMYALFGKNPEQSPVQ